MSTEIVEIDYEREALDEKALRSVTSAELMFQHQIARQAPRSTALCRRQAMELVTESEDIAEECIYAVKRGNKLIEGASIRFAEIFGACWGNNRVLARVVDAGEHFVTAQGIYQDLETNRVVVKEEQRRIVDAKGARYNIDMIGVTANAAASIALRNATLRGIAKPHWLPSYLAARSLLVGDARSMPVKRERTIAILQKMGANPDEVLRLLGVPNEADIDGDMLLRLRGIITSVREDQTSIEYVLRDIRGGRPKTDVGAKYRNGKTSHPKEDVGAESTPQVDTVTEAPADDDASAFLRDFTKAVDAAGSRDEVLAVVEEYDSAAKTFPEEIGIKVTEMVEARLATFSFKAAKKSAASAKL